MSVTFLRTIFLYLLVVASFRLMGKRQIGELQPSELAIAIMISELASIPMQDKNIPLLTGILPILTLIITEIIISYITLKNKRLRDIFSGTPSILIHKGKIVEQEMEKLRFTLDDLNEQLRCMNYPNIANIEYAILETNGQLSVIPKAEMDTVTLSDLNITPKHAAALPYTIIEDGKLKRENLKKSGKDENWLQKQLCANKISSIKDVFYMNYTDDDTIFIQKYEKKGAKS